MFASRTRVSAVVTIAMTGLLLSGCAGAAQSQKQACGSLDKDLSSAASELSSSFNKVQSDPKGAEKSLAQFDDALKTASAKLSNATIKSATSATITAVDKMDAALKGYITDSSQVSDLETAATGVQKTFAKLGALCTA
jgi:hypothetical protein